MKTYLLKTEKLLELPATGPLLGSERDATDIIGECYGLEIDRVVVPVVRLAPEFWKLRTGLAGGFIQKFVTYGFALAFVGDIAAELAASEALRDFVHESNRGKRVLFVPDLAELEARL